MMQSNDVSEDHDNGVNDGEGEGKAQDSDIRKRSLHDDEEDDQNEQEHRKQRAVTEVSLSDSRPTFALAAEPTSSPIGSTVRAVRNSNNNTTEFNSHLTTVTDIEQQQQQIQNQIRDLLMQQSALRAASSRASSLQPQQQVNEERLASIAQQQQQQRQQQQQQLLLLSNLTSGTTDRNIDLQRLMLLDRLGRSSETIHQNTDQQLLQRLLLLQGQGGGGRSSSDLSSLAASQRLSEQYQQQPQLNQLTASSMANQNRVAMSNRSNEVLIHELLLSQSLGINNNDMMNRYATAMTSINDSVGSRPSATSSLSTRTGQGSTISGGSRAMADRSVLSNFADSSAAQLPILGTDQKTTADSRLMSPRNRHVASSQREGQLKVGDDDDDCQINSSALERLQQQLQDRSAIANVTRGSSMADLSRNRYSTGQVLNTAINIPSSALQQLQQLHRQQQLAAVQDAAIRSVALQSLLASNSLPNPNTLRTSDRATIPNTNVTTLPMDSESDIEHLSRYQILIRRQLEYFVSQEDDVGYSVQGRKKQIVIGQVGIRCRHCSYLPHRLRGRGAGYYPAKLSGVYQAAQNMATNHLNQFCNVIPSTLRDELCSLRGGRHESNAGGGKQYWTNKCTDIGLMEYDDGVYFKGQNIDR